MRTGGNFILMLFSIALLSITVNCQQDSGGTTDTTVPTAGSVITFSGTSGTSTTVSWGAATDDTTAQASLRYKLVMASQDIDIDTVAEADAITGANLVMDWTVNITTEPVTGLSTNTKYYFAVIVRDAAENMSLYAPQSVTTTVAPDTTAPTVGTGISFSGTTSTGTTVNWGAASDNVTSQASLQYKVVRASASTSIDTVAEANAITGANLTMDWTANTITKAVTGLTASTTYYFAVIVRDAAGNMSLYSPQSVTTTAAADTTAPTVGTGISFSGTTSTGTTVNWGAATDNVTSQASLQYKVVRASASTSIDTVAEANAITGANLTMDWTANTITTAVTGLTASTTYYFAVIVRDAAGNMSLYSPQSVTTSSAGPSPIDQYRFENNGNDSVGSYNLTATGSPTYNTTYKKDGSYSVYLSNPSGANTNYLVNTSTSINVSSGMTVSAWIRFSSASNYDSIITLYNGTYYINLSFGQNVDPMPVIFLYDSVLDASSPTCNTSLSSGTWYHVVFTVDTSKNVLMYVNGSVIADSDTTSNVVNSYISTITRVDIGTCGGAYTWDGYIDDVRIYNKVLSAAEISALYGSY